MNHRLFWRWGPDFLILPCLNFQYEYIIKYLFFKIDLRNENYSSPLIEETSVTNYFPMKAYGFHIKEFHFKELLKQDTRLQFLLFLLNW